MPIQLPPISRRRFLAGSLAAGAGLVLPKHLLAEDVPVDPNRFALLSDTHIWVFDKTQPRGWVDARLHPDGITLTLSALDKKHPRHGQKIELKWRT